MGYFHPSDLIKHKIGQSDRVNFSTAQTQTNKGNRMNSWSGVGRANNLALQNNPSRKNMPLIEADLGKPQIGFSTVKCANIGVFGNSV